MAVAVLRQATPKLGGSRLPRLRQRAFASKRWYSFSGYVVTPAELDTALKANSPSKISTEPRVVPISAAWFMPNDPEGRDGFETFKRKRIPTARFFDIDGIKDAESPYPHMLPTCEHFAEAMSNLGIRQHDELVVYDTEELGLFSAPRVAWTFRVYGHTRVHILNNFRTWVQEGYPVETGEPERPIPTKYPVPNYNTDMVVKFAEMKTIGYDYGKEGAEEIQIIDARSPGRWAGTEKEPRPGLSSGHMPGSTNIPFQEVLHHETKQLLPREQLRAVFESKGLDPNKPIIASCGTGVTAAVLEAALTEADFGHADDRRLEWASRVTPGSGLIRTKTST
ncbi:hypothetical protein DV735_g4942, partial [Chaetothyriales sp. CBS 134920]